MMARPIGESPVWQQAHAGIALVGQGAQTLLGLPMVGFFASRQCPGFAIRAAMDWALQKAQAKQVVVSGFHSPLERSVFTVLKAARSPVVAVVARPIRAAKLPTEWAAPLAQGHMAAVSQATAARRLTSEEAAQRNDLVAQLASQIVVAYANPNGSLTKQVAQWRATGRIVNVLVQD